MPRPSFLTFANVASATALVIATTGGGFAVAAGLGKNVVGSAQIKKNAVKSADVKNDSLTGKDIKESKLGVVPLATKATSAGSVDSMVTKRATANPGQTLTLATKSTLVVELTCIDNGGGNLEAQVNIRTTADNAAFDANVAGDDDGDLDIADGPDDIVGDSGTLQEIEDGAFAAITAAGVSWKGYGMAVVHPGGANTCLGEMTFWD